MRRAAILRDHLFVATHRVVVRGVFVAVLPNDVLVAVRPAVEHRTNLPIPVCRVNTHPRILARHLLFLPGYFVLGD